MSTSRYPPGRSTPTPTPERLSIPRLVRSYATSIRPPSVREWDLLPTAVNAARFTHMADHQDRFAAVYGFDLRGWQHYPLLRRIRELQVTITVIPILSIDPGVRAEFHLRLGSIRANDLRPVWTPWPLVDLAAIRKPQQPAQP